jgi:hypothetical protein
MCARTEADLRKRTHAHPAAMADTAPLAICRAALKAVAHE